MSFVMSPNPSNLLGLVLVVVLAIIASGSSAAGPGPGMKIAVTQQAFNYLSETWQSIVKGELAALKPKDLTWSQKIRRPRITVNAKFSNITLNHLTVGSSSIHSVAHEGLVLCLENSSIDMSADWQGTIGGQVSSQGLINKLLGTILPLFKGSVRAHVRNMTLHIGLLVQAGEKGQPLIDITKCSVHINNLNVSFKGDGYPLLNRAAKTFEEKLKNHMNKTACEKVKDLLQDLEKDIPSGIPLDDISGIDLTLTRQPNFTNDAIEVELKGDFRSISQPNRRIPDHPAHLPPLTNTSRMAYIMATEYSANTAALVYMRAGKFRYDVTADSIHYQGPLLRLDTTTLSLVAPQLFHRFGNQSLMLTVRASKTPPRITLSEGRANFSLTVAIDVYTVCNQTTPAGVDPACDATMPLAMTIEMGVEAGAKFWLGYNAEHNDTLSFMGNCTYLNVTLNKVTKSNIGDVIDLRKIFRLATALRLVQTEALPRINKWANKGYKVPSLGVKGLTLAKPELHIHKGYVTLETDIEYQVKD